MTLNERRKAGVCMEGDCTAPSSRELFPAAWKRVCDYHYHLIQLVSIAEGAIKGEYDDYDKAKYLNNLRNFLRENADFIEEWIK